MTGTQIEKEEAKLPLFIDDMILHIKNPLKLLELIHQSYRIQDQYTKTNCVSLQ